MSWEAPTITIEIDGRTLPARWPYAGCEYVEVPGADCQTCASKSALMQGGRIVALAGEVGLREARREYPDAEVVPPPGPGSLRVRLPSYTRGHDRYVGTAVCARCGTKIGPMAVVLVTLFGLEEDEAVLVRGRCRVY